MTSYGHSREHAAVLSGRWRTSPLSDKGRRATNDVVLRNVNGDMLRRHCRGLRCGVAEEKGRKRRKRWRVALAAAAHRMASTTGLACGAAALRTTVVLFVLPVVYGRVLFSFLLRCAWPARAPYKIMNGVSGAARAAKPSSLRHYVLRLSCFLLTPCARRWRGSVRWRYALCVCRDDMAYRACQVASVGTISRLGNGGMRGITAAWREKTSALATPGT